MVLASLKVTAKIAKESSKSIVSTMGPFHKPQPKNNKLRYKLKINTIK